MKIYHFRNKSARDKAFEIHNKLDEILSSIKENVLTSFSPDWFDDTEQYKKELLASVKNYDKKLLEHHKKTFNSQL